MFSLIDPFLGYGYSSDDLPQRDDEKIMDGFVLYSNINEEKKKNTNTTRIVTLGGSTTTPHFEGNWPKQLYKALILMIKNLNYITEG